MKVSKILKNLMNSIQMQRKYMNKQEEIQDWNVRVSKRLQEAINEAWDEAEEIHSGLREMTDEEIIDCKHALIERASRIMSVLEDYAQSKEEC